MRTIWLVIKHDIGATLRQPSFWILTLLMPTLLIGMNAYAGIVVDGGGTAVSQTDENASTPNTSQELLHIGLVDDANLIHTWPADIPPDLFIPFDNEADARAALAAYDRSRGGHTMSPWRLLYGIVAFHTCGAGDGMP